MSNIQQNCSIIYIIAGIQDKNTVNEKAIHLILNKTNKSIYRKPMAQYKNFPFR